MATPAGLASRRDSKRLFRLPCGLRRIGHQRLAWKVATHDPAHRPNVTGTRTTNADVPARYPVRSAIDVVAPAIALATAVIFFTGIHHPCDARRVPAACISARALCQRRSGFPVRRWLLDSGAFRTIELHGGYPEPVEVYAALIRRFAGNGQLLAAVAQDYMCEAFMLARTGLTIADHQRLTIERYDALIACDVAGVRIMPVLQGYAAADYVRHVAAYEGRLAPRAWVGVGSVCKRNSNPGAVLAVLLAIHQARPDLRLHAFGVKITALAWQLIRDLLFSADSMAWSFAARYEGRDGNDPAEAVAYAERVARMPTQLSLGRW